MLLVEKRVRAAAIQFTGGEKNAQDVIMWLIANSFDGRWEFRSETVHGEDSIQFKNSEWIYIQKDRDHDIGQVPQGHWLVISEEDTPLSRGFEVMTDEKFQKNYTVIPTQFLSREDL